MPKVLITCMHLQRHFDKFREEYEAAGVEAVLPPIPGQQFGAEDMERLLPGMDCVIAGDDAINRTALAQARDKGLKAVIKWGIGTDGIDKVAARDLGLPVFNTPGVFGEEVADLALSYLLLLARGLHRMDASVRAGGWLKVEGRSLSGKTAGVVGLGSIGRAIARRCAAFGLDVIGSDEQQIDAAALADASATQVSFDALLEKSDFVVIACNLTPENHHLFDERAFARMKPGSFLINVARGQLVKEAALAEALKSGHLAGAGLDVFEVEPLPADSPLREFENCVFGTHNGSNTADAVHRVNRMTTDILFDTLGLRAISGWRPNRVA
ncbi:phosphoglycerate dehydrogenase [Mesorhizobium sp. L-8-3]|uniref:phosphoglycerate dehydrogenase n=1 Tax=Mesorhizobium sp. L-8-3 TaxID=2744522 RepID=UPI0019272EA1|nr:phosphoglycerate dehydrogenase [Mesorhizobium sp. L-8-3]BCH25925.1 phosphoglycerate dehydrogenase [Mesorhizobium sp. L-8-3]